MKTELSEDLDLERADLSANVSKVFRHLGNYEWKDIEPIQYKTEDGTWQGVSRRVFVGERGESPLFHTRYFEVAVGGHTSLEQHLHEHVVIVMRGQGLAVVGKRRLQLSFGDVLYLAPDEVHQLTNNGSEPFGFICVVNADRDRPRLVDPNKHFG